MPADFSFQRYLASKRTIDDRSLNRLVWKALEDRIAAIENDTTIKVLEVGGGIGTMLERMVEWGLLTRADYTLLDEMEGNIARARQRLQRWSAHQGLDYFIEEPDILLRGDGSEILIHLIFAEMTAYLNGINAQRWDLLVAHAFLDLVDTPGALLKFKQILHPGGLMYLTLNFDGLTLFEPVFDPELDARILSLYHRTMDDRQVGGGRTGGSKTGRGLFTWLPDTGWRILECGSSDWAVYPQDGRYRDDEAYFLNCILSFFKESLSGLPELQENELSAWLHKRRSQIERGELVYLAHQFDFLVESAW